MNINQILKPIKQFYISLTNWLVSSIPPDNFKDVLLMRLDELGDFVIWLDSAKEFRKIFPHKHITLLVNEKWKELAKILPYWDDIKGVDTKKFRFNPLYRLKILIWMRRQGFEIVICPRYSIQFLLEPALVGISGATHKIIYAGNFPVYKKNYFTEVISSSWQEHELIRNADFIRGLGFKEFKANLPKLIFEKNAGIHKYILICPSSLRRHKEWPLNKFEEIKLRLAGINPNIYICGNKKIDFRFVCENSNFTGRTSLMDFIKMIANASLVIANDSAAIHLAVALNVPSVCIGVERWGRFLPYQMEQLKNAHVLPRIVYREHIEDITVEDVWNVVKEVVNGYKLVHVGSTP